MEESQEQPTTKTSWLPPVQLVTNLAVVAGILVLIYELNQTRELAQVQTVDNAYLSAVSRNLALLGDAPQESIATAIFTPDQIQPADVVVLSKYYTAIVISWRRLKDDRAIGYFGSGWKDVVLEEAFNFNTHIGRKWWLSYTAYGDPEIIKVVDGVLAQTKVSDSLVFYQNLLPTPRVTPEAVDPFPADTPRSNTADVGRESTEG